MPKEAAGIDADAARRLLAGRGVAFGLGDIGKDGNAAFVEGAALRRQLQAARRAVDEARAQPRFEAGDELADGRRRHAAGRCGGGEAAELDGADEDFHFAGAIDVLTAHDEFKSQMTFF